MLLNVISKIANQIFVVKREAYLHCDRPSTIALEYYRKYSCKPATPEEEAEWHAEFEAAGC
jgi:hypothetical protein